jgi:hypothetical protein
MRAGYDRCLASTLGAIALAALPSCDDFYRAAGSVHDPRGRPVASARIYLSGEFESRRTVSGYYGMFPTTVTGGDGAFAWCEAGAKQFDVWIVVLKPGYAPYRRRVDVSSDGRVPPPPIEAELQPLASVPPSDTACTAPGILCDGRCVDPLTDHDHCGGCAPCDPQFACVKGFCACRMDEADDCANGNDIRIER